MKAICVEITKAICVTVEARNYDEAVALIEEDFEQGEYAKSWHTAEPQFKLLDEVEI